MGPRRRERSLIGKNPASTIPALNVRSTDAAGLALALILLLAQAGGLAAPVNSSLTYLERLSRHRGLRSRHR